MQDHGRGPEKFACKETSLGRCLVDGDAATQSRGRRMRRKALGISFTIEAAILAILVISPLLAGVAQPQFHYLPPIPIVVGDWHGHPSNQRTLPKPAHSAQRFASPVAQLSFPAPHAPAREDVDPSNDGVPGPPGVIIPGALLGPGIEEMPPRVAPPHIVPPRTQEMQAAKVSEVVQQAQLISRTDPPYPALARETRMQGTVRLRAIINREGRITALEVLSGPPLLVQAALNAVRQWRYQPTLLNGEPVEVETSITVVFRLSD